MRPQARLDAMGSWSGHGNWGERNLVVRRTESTSSAGACCVQSSFRATTRRSVRSQCLQLWELADILYRLSAVDAHTARHLIEKCLQGPLMKDRTVVLVTHHVQLCLPAASLIVRMTVGKAEPQAIETSDHSQASTSTSSSEDDDATRVGTGNNSKATPLPASTPVHATIITKENRETGSVKWKVYRLYLQAAGIETWIGILSMLLAVRLFTVLQQFYLKSWGESYNYRREDIGGLLPPASENVNPWLWIYFGLGFLYASLILTRLAFSYHGSFKAARKLLYDCLIRVTHAPSRGSCLCCLAGQI